LKSIATVLLVTVAGGLLGFTATFRSAEVPRAPADDAGICTGVDVRESLGPVRFQDDKAWCFAFATADLLSYRFRNELKGQRVSAVYTALTNARTFAVDPYSDAGGLARFSITRAYARGFCPQDLEDDALKRGPLGSLSEKLETLRTLKAMYDRKDMVNLNRKLDELAKTNSIVTTVSRPELMRLLQESTKRSFPIRFADLLCGSNRYKPTIKIDVDSMVKQTSGTTKMLRTIDEQLTAGNIVGIAYYSAFLLLGNDAPLADRHMSVLVGRRWNPKRNQCEYLIRNSFGPQCLGYAGDYRAPENCHEGHIWVPRNVLERNLYAITFIKP
jgi:hypothetical protein